MNSLTDVPSMSTLPPSSASLGARLVGSVVPRAQLKPADRDRMYELLSTYFEGTRRSQFESDLAEKESVVILRDSDQCLIQGFSTMVRMEVMVDSKSIVAFFSGDTIVAAEFWGESILSRLWSQTVFAEAESIVAQRPSTEVYWFLICSGYKTYRFLPVFFREFYPNPFSETPDYMQRILNTLGSAKFGECYDPHSGVVRFPDATPLREGVADITDRRLNDPIVAFFKG